MNEQTIQRLIVASDNGDGKASFQLGGIYEEEGDFEKAVLWYKIAALQGSKEAQNDLGYMYQNGENVYQDPSLAVKWYRTAADGGFAEAQNNLGLMYANGEGVEKNYKEAVKWFRKATEQNHAEAFYNLGVMYENGLGVEKNKSEASKCFRIAADKDMERHKAILELFNKSKNND